MDAINEFSKGQIEYILAFQEAFEDEESDFLIAAVTHKKSGKIFPCLLMQRGEDNIIPIGILAIPGDGILDDYDFGGGSQEENGGKRVEGVDFVYSREDNEGAEEEVEERPGFLKRISQRLLNR